jgi:uncharacterized protein YcbK (DUF882 family)
MLFFSSQRKPTTHRSNCHQTLAHLSFQTNNYYQIEDHKTNINRKSGINSQPLYKLQHLSIDYRKNHIQKINDWMFH